MRADLDTLVIALYVTIDELLGPRRGPGRRPKLTDAELVCLAVAQVLLGFGSERRWLRLAGQRLGHLFPYLPTASAYNRRLRRAGPLVALAIQDPGGADTELVGPAAAGRLHPGAVRGLPRDGQAVGAGRPCRLRLLQEPSPLLLGVSALCAGRR